MRRSVIALAFATASTAALSQQQTEPSREAVALARALSPDRVLLFEVGTVEDIRSGIERQLLNTIYASRGAPCDPSHPECMAAARGIAARVAPAIRERRQALIERTYALYFDRHLAPEEIRLAQAFLDTSAGREFGDALSNLTGMRIDEDRANEIFGTLMEEFRSFGDFSGLHDEFDDATSHLPRARLPRPTAPPAPPAPPRPPRQDRP